MQIEPAAGQSILLPKFPSDLDVADFEGSN